LFVSHEESRPTRIIRGKGIIYKLRIPAHGDHPTFAFREIRKLTDQENKFVSSKQFLNGL
jgi:hypothetical protein